MDFYSDDRLSTSAQLELAERILDAAQQHTPSTAALNATVSAQHRFVKRLDEGHSALPFQLLRGVFALSAKTAAHSRPLCSFDDVSDLTDGASVEYKGERLLQSDLRVLLGLVQQAAALAADNALVTLNAVEFLQSIGRSTCSRSIESLRESLANLRSATFVVKHHARDRGEVFGLVDAVAWDGREVAVKLSSQLSRALYSVGRTYVDMSKRNLLRDGVETALADLVKATNCTSYDVEAIARLWGRADAKETGREVRAALDRLVAVGLLKGWSRTRGRVHVERVAA